MEVQDLDEKIRSMITKSGSEKKVGQKKGFLAKCNVCGKEGPYKHMPQHVEANHITGVSHACNICGKVSRSRNALSMHMLNMHHCCHRINITGPEVI